MIEATVGFVRTCETCEIKATNERQADEIRRLTVERDALLATIEAAVDVGEEVVV